MKNITRTELISKLETAIEIVSDCPKNKSNHFYLAEGFYYKLRYALYKLKANDNAILGSLIAWFTPQNDWDTIVGDTDLGSEIYKLIMHLTFHLKEENN